MNPIILTSNNHKTHNWGGGSTTELFIYPNESDFKNKDFNFRLSTATVEIEKSNFTPLSGISRTLMVLDGEMTLHHENQHSKTLNKFNIDNFEGGWNTTSIGTCTDFNLMTRGSSTGNLEGLALKENQEIEYLLKENYCHLFVYIYKGEITVNNSHNLSQGSLLKIEGSLLKKLLLKSNTLCEVVIVTIL